MRHLMDIQVHNATKPALAGRALAATIALLALTSALAALMTRSRSRDSFSLAMTPGGWEVSVRLPKDVSPGQRVVNGPVTALPFHGRSADGSEFRLVLWRLPGWNDPRPLCALILKKHHPSAWVPDQLQEPTGAVKSLAGQEAIELLSPDGRTVVRGVALGNVGYAVSLSTEGELIDENLYERFNHTCRSMQREKN